MRINNKILFASTNRDKFEEMSALFATLAPRSGIELLPIEEIARNAARTLQSVETHNTYLENAMAKARLVNQGAHYATLADDSGLEVLALEGRPGVKSQRFAIAKAGEMQDQANTSHLIKELSGKPQRQARFVCTLVLLIEGIMLHSTGTLEGTIAETPRGQNGFGYDPVFIPKSYEKTFAELPFSEKNLISHRAVALKNLLSEVSARGIAIVKP